MSKKKSYEPDGTDFKHIHVPEINIDPTDPANYSSRVLPEQESRRRILTHARIMGCEREMLMLFAKYDKLIRTCSNEAERRDMSQLACTEVYRLLGGGGELYVNGQLVMKDN
jgi:hypothetical protein